MQNSRFSEEEVMTFKDLPTEAYELGVILKYNMAYQLIDFPACLQVVAATRMAQDHAEQQMVQRAIANELEWDEELKLQKIGQKCVTKTRRARIKLPELNTALVEVYRELVKATRTAKDMAISSK